MKCFRKQLIWKELTWPEIAMLVITRAAIGAGIGLLTAQKLDKERGTAAGWALLLIGAITTLPLAIDILGKSELVNTSDVEAPPLPQCLLISEDLITN